MKFLFFISLICILSINTFGQQKFINIEYPISTKYLGYYADSTNKSFIQKLNNQTLDFTYFLEHKNEIYYNYLLGYNYFINKRIDTFNLNNNEFRSTKNITHDKNLRFGIGIYKLHTLHKLNIFTGFMLVPILKFPSKTILSQKLLDKNSKPYYYFTRNEFNSMKLNLDIQIKSTMSYYLNHKTTIQLSFGYIFSYINSGGKQKITEDDNGDLSSFDRDFGNSHSIISSPLSSIGIGYILK